MSRRRVLVVAAAPDGAPPVPGATGLDPTSTIAGIARALGHEVQVARATWSALDDLARVEADVALDLCEGLGRDGQPGVEVREALRAAGVRTCGAPAIAAALALDKALAREALRAAGLRVPAGVCASEVPLPAAALALGPPWVLKPRQGAGSHGLEVVVDPDALERRASVVLALHGAIVVEAFVPGLEMSVPVLGDGGGAQVLPPVAVVWRDDVPASRRVLDLAAKHDPGSEASAAWRLEAPARLEPAARAVVEATARAAHAALGLRGLSRVDLRLDAHPGAMGAPVVLEVNPDATLEPAVTRDEGGLLAASLRAAGRSWSWVVGRLIEGAT